MNNGVTSGYVPIYGLWKGRAYLQLSHLLRLFGVWRRIWKQGREGVESDAHGVDDVHSGRGGIQMMRKSEYAHMHDASCDYGVGITETSTASPSKTMHAHNT